MLRTFNISHSMKDIFYTGLLLILIIWSCQQDEYAITDQDPVEKTLSYTNGDRYFVVANRGSSSISIYSAQNAEFIANAMLPDKGAQPTYLAHSSHNKSIYVGDFSTNKVIIYDDQNFSVKSEIAIDQGPFHMSINEVTGQLWVNTIISKTTTVIDLKSNRIVATLSLPVNEIPELTSAAVQHDVVLSANGKKAFVTILDEPELTYLLTYDTSNFKYLGHQLLAGDAHIYATPDKFYVASQLNNLLTVFNSDGSKKLAELPHSSAHSIIGSFRHLFITGISDATIGIYDKRRNQLLDKVDTDFPVPHNISINKKGSILCVSHSGTTATRISFYTVTRSGQITKLTDHESGLDPFGVLSY